MNELKPEDVMRALEICAKPYSQSKVSRCKTCPYWERECHKEFIPNILTLLREKNATLEMCAETIERQDKELAQKDAEIERLNKEVDRLSQIVMYHGGQIADAQANAIDELLLRAKSQAKNMGDLKPFITIEDLERIAMDVLGVAEERKVAVDISDNGMERWRCPCGRISYEKEEVCRDCGAKLEHKESLL